MIELPKANTITIILLTPNVQNQFQMFYQRPLKQNNDKIPDISLSLLEISNAYGIPSPIPGLSLLSNCEFKSKSQLLLVTSDLSPIHRCSEENTDHQFPDIRKNSNQRVTIRKVKTTVFPTSMQTTQNFNLGFKSTATTPKPAGKLALNFDPLKMYFEKTPFQKTTSNFMKIHEKATPRTDRPSKNGFMASTPNENAVKTITKFKITGFNELRHRRTMSSSENFFKKSKDTLSTPRVVAVHQNKEPLMQTNFPENQKKTLMTSFPICAICLTERSSPSRLSCGHMFCKNCIKGYIHGKIQERIVPIICPDSQCSKEIVTVDVWRLATIQDYQKFEKMIAK